MTSPIPHAATPSGEIVQPTRTRPFLRWAGGKRWLTPTLEKMLHGRTIAKYYEPFLGGGSIFFGLDHFETSSLSDLNSELIETYREVRDNPDEVFYALQRFPNTAAAYYRARSSSPERAIDRAARFIYLNHTSFNGIYRVNLKGEYNVPFGHRSSPNIPDMQWLRAVSRKLTNAQLAVRDFEEAVSTASRGDFVFMDPPYTIAHNRNGFVKYNQQLFSYADQKRLASTVADLHKRGVAYAVTNAAHDSIRDLYAGIGDVIETRRRNSIGGKSAARGRGHELMFTNLGGTIE